MKKQSDKNSAASAVAGFAGVIDNAIPLTANVELCSEKTPNVELVEALAK